MKAQLKLDFKFSLDGEDMTKTVIFNNLEVTREFFEDFKWFYGGLKCDKMELVEIPE